MDWLVVGRMVDWWVGLLDGRGGVCHLVGFWVGWWDGWSVLWFVLGVKVLVGWWVGRFVFWLVGQCVDWFLVRLLDGMESRWVG